MSFIDKQKAILDDPKASPYHRTVNKESGPAGPLNIDTARDWEILWRNGRAILLKTPRSPCPEGENMELKRTSDSSWNRGGSNTGTLPDDPNAPRDKLVPVKKDTKITEENMTLSYVARLAETLAMAAPLTFKDVLKILKRAFPELIMQFPKPPTYVWNPKPTAAETPDKEKEGEGGEEDDEDAGQKEKLEPQKIKDKLKVKLPQLKWTSRMMDGVEESELEFTDGSSALFEIGAKANHLTVTYTQPPKRPVTIEYDDSTGDENEDEETSAK